MRVVVVIPACQEERNVARAVASVKLFATMVVVVDDGSSDHTSERAAEAGAVVLRHAVNRGYGAALTTGTAYALTHGADVVVHFDADGQFEASEIPSLLAKLTPGTPGAVFGSRFLGTTVGLPLIRRLTLKLAILFTWVVSGIKLTDAHNGFRAFTAPALRLMNMTQDRMAYSSEVVDELVRLNIPLVEVPVTVRYTTASIEGSKQGKFPVLRIVKDLFFGKLVR